MANADRESSPTVAPAGAETCQERAFERAILLPCVLAWLGATVSLLLAHATSRTHGLLCPVRTGCEAVLSSRYAAIQGIPLPWLGVAFYATVMLLLVAAYGIASHHLRVRLIGAVFRLSVIGASFSGVLMFIQFVVLRAFCPLCTLSAVVAGGLLVASARAERLVAKADFRGRGAGALALTVVALISAVPLLISGRSPQEGTLAVVDGQAFTRDQMEEELGVSHQSLQRSIFNLELNWVRRKVEGALLAVEAKKSKTTGDDLLSARMSAIKPISDAEIDARFARSGLVRSQDLVERIEAELLAERRELARGQYIEELAGKHRVEVFLKPVAVNALNIDLATAKVSGPPDAKVQLVVFSDFECRHCAELAVVLKQVRSDFRDDVMVAYRYFPIEGHARAFPAAVAAECAAEQGAFWEYHDKLYEQAGDLSDASLVSTAGALGLDRARFVECQKSTRARAVVEASRVDADANGLEGVPVLFLNGKRIGGMLDYDHLSQRIRAVLNSSATAKKQGTGKKDEK